MAVKKETNTSDSQFIEWCNLHKFQLAPIDPMLTSKYYEYLIDPNKHSCMLKPWDYIFGVPHLTGIVSLKDALQKKLGILDPERFKRDPSFEID